MQNGIAPLHRGLDAEWIANVSGNDLEFALDVGIALVEPTPRVERVVLNECTNVVPFPNKQLGEV